MYEKGIKKLGQDLNLIDFIKTQKNLKTLAKCQNLLTKERMAKLEHTRAHLIDLETDSSYEDNNDKELNI